jgi:ketosteroid isomerase-like protein
MKNKEIIRKVNKGFASGDTQAILSHLTDDIRWDIAGISKAIGKEAFRKEISNEHFEGLPTITIKNEIEEGDFVAVEGEVQCKIKGGGILDAVFFDLYRMENGKIKELKSFVVEKVRTDSMSVFRP